MSSSDLLEEYLDSSNLDESAGGSDAPDRDEVIDSATNLVRAFAHQIRNPLTYSLAGIDVLRDELDMSNRDVVEMFQALQLGVSRLRETLGEVELLVKHARRDSGSCDLTALVEEVCRALPYHIHTREHFETPVEFDGDRGLLAQLLFNVLATHAQTSKEETATLVCRHESGTVRFEVGGGRPDEEIAMRVDFLTVIRGGAVRGDNRRKLIGQFVDELQASYTRSPDEDGTAVSVVELEAAT